MAFKHTEEIENRHLTYQKTLHKRNEPKVVAKMSI